MLGLLILPLADFWSNEIVVVSGDCSLTGKELNLADELR